MKCQPDRKRSVKTFHLPFVNHVCDKKVSNPSTFLERFQSLFRSSSAKSNGDHLQSRPKFLRDSRNAMPRTISWSTASCSIFSMRLLPLIGFWSLWPASGSACSTFISTSMSLTLRGAVSLAFVSWTLTWPTSSSSFSLNLWRTTSLGTSEASSWQHEAFCPILTLDTLATFCLPHYSLHAPRVPRATSASANIHEQMPNALPIFFSYVKMKHPHYVDCKRFCKKEWFWSSANDNGRPHSGHA